MKQETLNNENDLFAKLLGLIAFQFENNTKPFKVLKAAISYKVHEFDRDHAYNVYKIRRDLGQRTLNHLKEFDEVLENLCSYEGERILIHIFKIDGGLLLFFTSIDCDKIFGFISSGENGEGFEENK
ncbi:hypothetical protein Cpin_4779 [Chitinophaga pinensis DSM 2588]|uniref:Uncharacterized protein n=2 Tax=Chitinophaga pinensis TaxID=79329 RepID=A0A979G7S8_CHIPD|nr:hypothetical protein Cpin_4779 [Chitinophaga pinensis DSM 2588]